MSRAAFRPTSQQRIVIRHEGSAFVSACPGGGKTRVMVERADRLFQSMPLGQGVAFLSFTRAAISELETRLRRQAPLASSPFPSFIGTFDSFVWRFLIAPFGLPGSNACPRIIPDMHELDVVPYPKAHPLPLACFDTVTGRMDEEAAKRRKFDISKKTEAQIRAYTTAANNFRGRLRQRGEVGFDEARAIALERVNHPAFSSRIAVALVSRFREVIVDEAQDCNPEDLKIILWLLDAGLPVKIICDPHQSIFGFRGGVTEHLFAFAQRFQDSDKPALSGNFRSSNNICRAIALLRPPSAQEPDHALGRFKDEPSHVHVIAYPGTAVTSSIGSTFSELVHGVGEDISECPVVAATKASAAAAVGQPRGKGKKDITFRLAEAVMSFHFASGFDDQRSAIEETHRIILQIQGRLLDRSYGQYISEEGIRPASWRATIVWILRKLRFDPDVYPDARAWHERAKHVLGSCLLASESSLIPKKLRWNSGIETLLSANPVRRAIPRTIHSVKGKQFPAVCVVATTRLKGILDFLENGAPAMLAEEARKLYVAASRAEKLLAFAAPKGQATRFSSHLRKRGAEVTFIEI